MRALFLTSYPVTAAATRFRLQQFFAPLEREGVTCVLSPFLSEREFATFYVRGGAFGRSVRLLLKAALRIVESARALRFDVVVVQRNAMLFGPPVMEWLIRHLWRRPLVYDYDDAIWLQDRSLTYGAWASWAKFTGKTAGLIRMADHVVVCNQFTRDYALRYRAAADVTVVPTVVDPTIFTPVAHAASDVPVVGWIGTHSTARYLQALREPLAAAARRAPFRLKIVGAGVPIAVDGVAVENKAWRLDEEVADYQSLDVGLYPVDDDEWGRGKTGFKPVVYMSCGVPCVCSPVGGVQEFIRDGENGFFAVGARGWEEAIVRLVSDAALRARVGRGARDTVLGEYSLQVQAPRLASVLRRAAG